MRFYLGVHRPHWLAKTTVPLFVSRRTLDGRRSLPVASCDWVLDSGGYSELSMYGEWRLRVDQYAEEIHRYQDGIGGLAWAAPMDWMCEPGVLAATGLTVAEHQVRTIENFLRLRDRCGRIVAPVLQGWTLTDYERHVYAYDAAGIDLRHERIVGVGSVCRRDQDAEIQLVLRGLAMLDLRLHAFGVRSEALRALSDVLTSADSMAWSYAARMEHALPGCSHRSCANCLRYAERWHAQQLMALGQQRLEIPA